MRTLALIPARSGSKGIPGKNVRPFCGRPLIAWAIEVGLAACDACVVTTDSTVYAVKALKSGASVVMRPERLAGDETPMLDVVRHALDTLAPAGPPPDAVVLLQPTQPLRTAQHVIDAIALLEDRGADSVVSVVEIPAHYSPQYALSIDHRAALVPFLGVEHLDQMPTRRQDARLTYSRDGTVYAIRRQTIEAGSLYGSRCVPLLIPAHASVNLDTEDDWKRAEAMVNA